MRSVRTTSPKTDSLKAAKPTDMSDAVVIAIGIVFLVCLCRKEIRRWWTR